MCIWGQHGGLSCDKTVRCRKMYFFFVFSLNRFSNLQQVAHCFEQLHNTEAIISASFPFCRLEVEQHCIKYVFTMQRNVSVFQLNSTALSFRLSLQLTITMTWTVFLWRSLDLRYWYYRHRALPTSQSFSDSIIQAVHCRGRRYPECNCQLFSLWINPKENSRPRSAQTGYSPTADRWISINEAIKQKLSLSQMR